VRSLAQRSAAAAKEIKGLVTDSASKVAKISPGPADLGTLMSTAGPERSAFLRARYRAPHFKEESHNDLKNWGVLPLIRLQR